MTADRPPLAEGIPDRLYGRRRGHPLRPRQQRLLDETLPRLRLDPAAAADPRAAFGIPATALWLEVGFGGGEHALEHVRANPGIGYIASEVFENGLCSLLSRLVAEGAEATGALPPNLRLWPQDARHLLGLLPAGCLDRLMLMFPDPWPKARHAKRRFVNPALLPLVARALRPGGEWRIASDDPTYQGWVAEVLAAQALFAVPPPAEARPAGWPGTRYEAKALREGRRPLYWTLTRHPDIGASTTEHSCPGSE
jgi:tRNA (guanine-N7-)-methyltransferase